MPELCNDGILFLCVANSTRSQMAEGLARKLFGEPPLGAERGQRAGGCKPVRDRVAEKPADLEPVALA
jgi:protein-tyrosine-phosphatase